MASGYTVLPGSVQIGGVLTARSAQPFNITTGRDNNVNGVSTDRPDLAPGARAGTADMLDRASFVDPGRRPGNLPRNAGRGLDFWQLDARVAKRFHIGRASADALIEAFNVTNRINYGNPVGNLASSSFGRPNTALDARQVQLVAESLFGSATKFWPRARLGRIPCSARSLVTWLLVSVTAGGLPGHRCIGGHGWAAATTS